MNCKDCKFKGPIAFGSGHHRTCVALTDDLTGQLLLTQASIKDKTTGEDAVVQNPHGVKNGWCTWPINFDPIWIESCIFFTERD